MARYVRQDHYSRKAKAEGRVSRASFKLDELQAKYHLVNRGDKIVDLGCAPGGWLRVLSQLAGPTGRVVGIDRTPLKGPLPPNVDVIEADIAAVASLPMQVTSLLGGPADLITSDLAPRTTGVKFQDAVRSYELAMRAWTFCQAVLKPGGAFLVKVFEGPEIPPFRALLRAHFRTAAAYQPAATRAGSREIYLIGRGLRGGMKKTGDPRGGSPAVSGEGVGD